MLDAVDTNALRRGNSMFTRWGIMLDAVNKTCKGGCSQDSKRSCAILG